MAEVKSCSQALSGIARDCTPSMGGVRRVLIANYSDVSSVEVATDKVSTITMADTAKFHEYTFKNGIASMTHTLNVDQTTGANFVTTDLVLGFNRMETAKRVEIAALAVNDLAVIVEDNNGAYWYLGKDEPVNASAGDGGTGTARTDKNGYGITLQDNSKSYPYEVDAAIIAGLIA